MSFLPLLCHPLPDAASKIQAHLVSIHRHGFLPDVLLFSFTYFSDQIVCGLHKRKVLSPLFLGTPSSVLSGPLLKKHGNTPRTLTGMIWDCAGSLSCFLTL